MHVEARRRRYQRGAITAAARQRRRKRAKLRLTGRRTLASPTQSAIAAERRAEGERPEPTLSRFRKGRERDKSLSVLAHV